MPEYPDEDASFGLFGRSLRDAAKRFPDAARHLEGAARLLEARCLQDAGAAMLVPTLVPRPGERMMWSQTPRRMPAR